MDGCGFKAGRERTSMPPPMHSLPASLYCHPDRDPPIGVVFLFYRNGASHDNGLYDQAAPMPSKTVATMKYLLFGSTRL